MTDNHTVPDASREETPGSVNRCRIPVCVLLAGAAIMVGGFLYLLNWRSYSLSTECIADSFQLGFWMMGYQEEHGHLPPAYIESPDGTPMHSWRILIAQRLFSFQYEYEFDEPWNTVRNQQIAKHRPRQYACPSDSVTRRNRRLTNHFLVTGRNTPFPGAGTTVGPRGTSNTILMVEARDLDIEWLEPRDLAFDRMSFIPNDPKRPSISSHHANGPFVVMADWSVRSIKGIDPGVLRRMLEYHPDEEAD